MTQVVEVDAGQAGLGDGGQPRAAVEVAVPHGVPIGLVNTSAWSSSGSRRSRWSASSALMMSENGTARRPALDLGGPNADPPPSCSMSCRTTRIVQVSRSMSQGWSAASLAQRRLARVPSSTSARYRGWIAAARS